MQGMKGTQPSTYKKKTTKRHNQTRPEKCGADTNRKMRQRKELRSITATNSNQDMKQNNAETHYQNDRELETGTK